MVFFLVHGNNRNYKLVISSQKQTHLQKFSNLVHVNTVINLSNIHLTPTEQKVLYFNFSISKIPKFNIIIAIEDLNKN